jgi:hypothetical protein
MRDFNNIETRTVITFFSPQGKAHKETHDILRKTLVDLAPLYAILKNWVAQYKHHDSSTCNAPHDWTT